MNNFTLNKHQLDRLNEFYDILTGNNSLFFISLDISETYVSHVYNLLGSDIRIIYTIQKDSSGKALILNSFGIISAEQLIEEVNPEIKNNIIYLLDYFSE